MAAMNANLALAGVGLAASSGFLSVVFAPRRPLLATWLNVGAMLASAACGMTAAVRALFGWGDAFSSRAWSVPGGSLDIRLDAIASVFLIQVLLIGTLGSIYAIGYWPYGKHSESVARLRIFYGLMVAGMSLLVIAKNAVLFLVGWETMALAAFFAVTAEDRDAQVRECGLVYLVATRLGTLALFAMFALLHVATGSFELPTGTLSVSSPLGSVIFCLGLFGFGLKAGVMPLHVWLPGAHANAPTHVSALMSGVLIKMGIYGLIRTCSFFATVPLWWGIALFALGALSALLGVAFALGQHDLKRLLAYHSVENVGIIVMGLGVAMIGRATGRADIVALGLSGAVLHTFNHGLFKALLFFGAGSVISSVGTRDIDQMGALARRLPFTALSFLIGAVAICGLPPLNGFVSELLVYMAMLRGGVMGDGAIATLLMLGVPLLAMVGALAVACFCKAHGVVFLGEPRTPACSSAQESPRSMLYPMAVLAVLCVAIGTMPLAVVGILERTVSAWLPESVPVSLMRLVPLGHLTSANAALVVGIALFILLFRRLTPSSQPASMPTWDCGYVAPTPRMQYTASSMAEWLVGLFSFFLRPRVHTVALVEEFPKSRRFATHVPEVVLDLAVLPALRWLVSTARWFRWIQPGRTHLYIVYILFALVSMLFIWR